MIRLPKGIALITGVLTLAACGSGGSGIANNDPGNAAGGSGGLGVTSTEAGRWGAGGTAGNGAGGKGGKGSDAGPPCVPHKETCNGKDDDCDGKVDNGSNLCPEVATCTGGWKSCGTTHSGDPVTYHYVDVQTGQCVQGSCAKVHCLVTWGCQTGSSSACTAGAGCNYGYVGSGAYMDFGVDCQNKGYPLPDTDPCP